VVAAGAAAVDGAEEAAEAGSAGLEGVGAGAGAAAARVGERRSEFRGGAWRRP
jgi:hypothetical protein